MKKTFIPSLKKITVFKVLRFLECLDLNCQNPLLTIVQTRTPASRGGACSLYHPVINVEIKVLKNSVQLDRIFFPHNHFLWQVLISETEHLFFMFLNHALSRQAFSLQRSKRAFG